MKSLDFLLACVIVASPLKAQTHPFIQDGDLKHIGYSGGIYVATEQVLYPILKDEDKSKRYAFFTAFTLGLGKELGYDMALGKGTPSMRDMKLNIGGIILSYFINEGINKVLKRNEKKIKREG